MNTFKTAFLAILALSFTFASTANAVDIVAERTKVHDTAQLDGLSLNGYETYRIYARLDSPNDRLAAVMGGSLIPGFQGIQTTGGDIFVHPEVDFKGPLNAALFDQTDSSYQYSSFITIGKLVSEDPGQFFFADEPGAPWLPENGVMDMDGEYGSAVFAAPSPSEGPNTLPNPNNENRILIMQVTTNGLLNGQVCLQILPNGQHVELQDGQSWTDLLTCQDIDVVTSVSNADKPTIEMSLYPNPANQQVWIRIDDSSINPSQTFIRVFDMAGRVVLEQGLSSLTSAIDISELSSGAYVLMAKDNKGQFGRKKFIKQ